MNRISKGGLLSTLFCSGPACVFSDKAKALQFSFPSQLSLLTSPYCAVLIKAPGTDLTEGAFDILTSYALLTLHVILVILFSYF